MSVDKCAKEDVYKTDEGLSRYHALPEIPWVTHLTEEGDKEQGATVRIYNRVDAGHGGSST